MNYQIFVGSIHQTITSKGELRLLKMLFLSKSDNEAGHWQTYAYPVFKINQDNAIELWKTAELYNVNETLIVKQ